MPKPSALGPRHAAPLAALLAALAASLAAPALAQAPAIAPPATSPPAVPPPAVPPPAALVPVPGTKVLARVNGVPVTEDELRIALEDVGPAAPGDDAAKRAYALDYLIDLKLIAQVGEKEKLAEGPDVARRLAYAKDRVVMERVLVREGEKAGGEAAIRKFYDETVKGLDPEPEVRARHVLVPTEEEAKAALARIKGGEDFAKVAADLSKDPGSGKEGGELGWFARDAMVPEFSEAAFKAKAGETVGPVKSAFGWHVIQVEERRDRTPPSLDQVKEQLQRYLAQKSQQDLVLKLRAAAKVERLEGQPRPEAPEKAPVPAPAKK